MFQDVLTPSAPGDYTPLYNTLTLTSSAPMANVSIAIFSDAVVESNEQFIVMLSSSDPNVITPVNPAVVIIGNDDGMLPQSRVGMSICVEVSVYTVVILREVLPV